MKLKNKLLPFIGIAATVATATPLALTSCKSNNGIELIDLTDGSKAVPTIDPMESLSSMGKTEYTTAYVKAVKENPEIFKQDLLYSVYTRAMDGAERLGKKYDYLKAGCTTPTFDAINISYPGEPDVQYPTISFSYSVQFSKTESQLSSGSFIQTDTVQDYTLTVTNVPFMIDCYTSANKDTGTISTVYWVEWPSNTNYDYVWKYNLNSWSIDYSYNKKTTITSLSSSGRVISEDSNSDAGTLNCYKNIHESGNLLDELSWGFYSHYLSNVVPAPEFITKKVYAGSETNPIAASYDSGLSAVAHGGVLGLYLPADSSSTRYSANTLSIALYSGYDDEGKPVALKLEQVLDESSTAKPVYMTFDTTSLAYNSDYSTGWNGSQITYNDNSFIPYLFPAATVADEDGAALKPTVAQGETEAVTFKLPKSVIVHFSADVGLTDPYEWDQEVWLSQDEMVAYVKFA